MKTEPSLNAKNLLGAQIWIERDDSPENIDKLFSLAADTGLGWVRLILMWPWIEEKPGVWDFKIWDMAFDAAAKYGIKVKTTLTANSPAWHVGPQSQATVLHSHNGFLGLEQREPMRRYIQECVKRYHRHPGLGQWILWNEPFGGGERTEETLGLWRDWLKKAYAGDIEKLNQCWLSGYKTFEELPFPENIPLPIHRGSSWIQYAPWLEDWKARSAWLVSEIRWIASVVKEIDPHTPHCVNPSELIGNLAACGTDLGEMGASVDIMGASYHPSWHFTFAKREDFPALMTAGVRLQAAVPSIKQVEVTEVQFGGTVNSAIRPCDAEPAEVARFILAGLAGGAKSVTGWLLNVRSGNFEAGDWALLDNRDQPSERSRMLQHLRDRLEFAGEKTGTWDTAPTQVWIGYDPRAQALEWVESKFIPPIPGRNLQDGAQGHSLLAVAAMQCGLSATMSDLRWLPSLAKNGDIIVLSHVVAWDSEMGKALIGFVEAGGTLLTDATCGRRDFSSFLNRPWPGGFAEKAGFQSTGLSTRLEGWEVTANGVPMGRWVLARLDAELNPAAGWKSWSDLRYAHDDQACVWERSLGKGRLVVVRGMIGPSLAHNPESIVCARYILERLASHLPQPLKASHPHAITVPVTVEKGSLIAVLGPDHISRKGQALHLSGARGKYLDLWTGQQFETGPAGELVLEAAEGIGLLWKSET